jgi:hypothetical protein
MLWYVVLKVVFSAGIVSGRDRRGNDTRRQRERRRKRGGAGKPGDTECCEHTSRAQFTTLPSPASHDYAAAAAAAAAAPTAEGRRGGAAHRTAPRAARAAARPQRQATAARPRLPSPQQTG